jgi:hypothetical protein
MESPPHVNRVASQDYAAIMFAPAVEDVLDEACKSSVYTTQRQ